MSEEAIAYRIEPLAGGVLDEALALRRAASEAQAAAEWLRSPYLEARLCAAVAAAHVQSSSPWLDRAGAAAHARCSTSEIDRAANAGVFKRYLRAGTPLFRKDEIDEAIAAGKWPRRTNNKVTKKQSRK